MENDHKDKQDPISEEELIELVLEAQKEALEKSRQQRLSGVQPTKRNRHLSVWLLGLWL